MGDDLLQKQKKELLPLLNRAQEIEKHNPKIAYYMRMHALDQAVAIGTKNLHPEFQAVCTSLLKKLEQTKPLVGIDKTNDPKTCLDFAMSVFNRADNADRGGKSDKMTATTFLAAFYFLDMLEQFEGMPAEVTAKQRYAAYRAAQISKAVREGRQPEPPSTGEADMSVDDETMLMASLGIASPMPTSASNEELNKILDAATKQPDHTDDDAHEQETPPSAPQQSHSHQGRSFELFQKVLYLAPNSVAIQPSEGTIGKITMGNRGQQIYHVALKTKVVEAEAHNLAPMYQPGDQVVHYDSDGEASPVVIEDIYCSRWPPTYMVQKKGGGLETVDDETLGPALVVVEGQQDKATAPPAVAAPPPPKVEKKNKPVVAAPVPPPPPQPPVETSKMDLPSVPKTVVAPPPPAVVLPAAPKPAPVPAHPIIPDTPVPGYTPPVQVMMEAEKLAKTAASSISFEDVPTAVKYLSDALKLLTGQGKAAEQAKK